MILRFFRGCSGRRSGIPALDVRDNRPRNSRDATPRHGRHDSAIVISAFSPGRGSMPSAWPTARLQRDVARGKDVGMAGGKQQIDLGRPRPDAGNGGHRADRLVRLEPAQTRRDRGRRARPRRPRAAPRCFGRDRPASRNKSSPAASRACGVSGSTSLVKRPKIASALARRDLLRDDDRGKAVRSPAPTAGAAPRRQLARTCRKPGIDQAKRVEPFGNVVESMEIRRIAALVPCHCLTVAISACALQPATCQQ